MRVILVAISCSMVLFYVSDLSKISALYISRNNIKLISFLMIPILFQIVFIVFPWIHSGYYFNDVAGVTLKTVLFFETTAFSIISLCMLSKLFSVGNEGITLDDRKNLPRQDRSIMPSTVFVCRNKCETLFH